MLAEVNSAELSEWIAFFAVKEQRESADYKAAEAKARAKQNNR
jgi:hypothetical protein